MAKPEARHICHLILKDFGYAEIAAQIGISERAAQGHIHRLRTHARHPLASPGLARDDRY
jgi:DNA-directed RNA polymerase specialized sigma24 family protein